MQQSSRVRPYSSHSGLSLSFCHRPIAQTKVSEPAPGQVPISGKVKAHVDICVILESESDSLRALCPPSSTSRRVLTTCQRPRQADPCPWRDSGAGFEHARATELRDLRQGGPAPGGGGRHDTQKRPHAREGGPGWLGGRTRDSGSQHYASSSTLAHVSRFKKKK